MAGPGLFCVHKVIIYEMKLKWITYLLITFKYGELCLIITDKRKMSETKPSMIGYSGHNFACCLICFLNWCQTFTYIICYASKNIFAQKLSFQRNRVKFIQGFIVIWDGWVTLFSDINKISNRKSGLLHI